MTECGSNDCRDTCCKDDKRCALSKDECELFPVGETCITNNNCETTCCVKGICEEGDQCKSTEIGMLSFFAIFILGSIIILVIGFYFHIRRKRKRNLARRFRAPRIRQIIAEGQIIEDKKPPILTIGFGNDASTLSVSDSQTELNKPVLLKLEPSKPTLDVFDQVVWRNRSTSRTIQFYSPPIKAQKADTPQELNNFDPYLETKSSPMRKPIDMAKEVPLEEVTISNELANQILQGFDLDADDGETSR